MANTEETRDQASAGAGMREFAVKTLGKLNAPGTVSKPRFANDFGPAPMTGGGKADVHPASVGGPGASVVSKNVDIQGAITSPDEMHIYGKIKGDVRAQSLTIWEGGVVSGDIVAERVTVRGLVEGKIHGQIVQISGPGLVRGDIIHAALGIEVTATFEGVSKRVADPMSEVAPKQTATLAA